MSVLAMIRAAPIVACQPWPRHVLQPAGWAAMAAALAGDPADLLALWADTIQVHALLSGAEGDIAFVSTPVADGAYAALSPHRPAAAWFERMVHDLWGHLAIGGVDLRPWLDHGHWEQTRPLSARPHDPAEPPNPQAFLTAPPGLHQWPLGPVHDGIGEPGHFRINATGEAVVQMEARLGYAHKGTLTLMRGKSPRAAARFAARLSGDATVAHAIAFARAAEAASGVAATPRAHALRGVMAELERVANHLGCLAALCGRIPSLPPRFAWHREAMLRAAAAAFGHRLMMDCVIPGGVVADVTAADAITDAIDSLLDEWPRLISAYDKHLAPLFTGIGIAARVAAFAAPGVVGRAAGLQTDARRWPGYPPYDVIDVPTAGAGDVDARIRVRLAEVPQSSALVTGLLQALPPGVLSHVLPSASGEGLGVAESIRGDVWHWLRLDGGLIGSAFAADPSWRIWPLVERAGAGATMADLPLIVQSFDGSHSGVDL